jgi:hypothetical protein
MSWNQAALERQLQQMQQKAFSYFQEQANPLNGLVVDKTAPHWPASIAATGLALASYPVAVERGFMAKSAAVERTLITLRFFWNSPQGPQPDATGYRGLYYHFLDMSSGRRAWQCELSTVDTAFLLAGHGLVAAAYFTADLPEQREIRSLAEALYLRADWPWAQDGAATICHGWKPESGFLPHRWEGYDEALLLYMLALGSASVSSCLPSSYARMEPRAMSGNTATDTDYLYAGPLFTHQLSHVWIDFRGIQDEFMRGKGIDYFENSRRATYVQQQYAIHNPRKFTGYGSCCWGITASDGPGPETINLDGIERQFFGYVARAVPNGPDDGTVAPWAVVASLPFAAEIVLPAIDHFIHGLKLKESNPYGFRATFNATHPGSSESACGWVSPWHFGLNQGPVVLMIENYRSGLFWRLTRNCEYICNGLRRAGFTGGWL